VLSESGKVIAVECDGVWVETLKLSTCGQCRARHGCGQKLLVAADSNLTCIKAFYSSDSTHGRPQLGDDVLIGVDETAMVLDALLSYGLPLLCMFLALAGASYSDVAEIFMMLAAVVGLLIGGGIVRFLPNRKGVRPQLLGQLSSVISVGD